MAVGSPIALEVLERIGELYGIEREIKGRTPEERYCVRQARALPRLQALHAWLAQTLGKVSKSSELAKAIRYTIKSAHWHALTYYCEDGRAEIDNLTVERQIRPVALGRSNFLFAGSDTGGERAAVAYSLIGTARLNGVDPETYLWHVLERIADHPINRVSELLPWNVPLPSMSSVKASFSTSYHRNHRDCSMSENSTDSDARWTQIDELMKAGGQITLGRMAPLDGVAVAADDKDIYAVLRRRPEESVAELLQRLDQAFGSARNGGSRTNEIDDNRYALRMPSTRKRK